jgi:hypothetical protein
MREEEKLVGHLPPRDRLKKGDIVLDPDTNFLYGVLQVEYCCDPKDMFFADVEILKCIDDIGEKDIKQHQALGILKEALNVWRIS